MTGAPPPPQTAQPTDDERFMRVALEEARRAALHGDVPVGAVVVQRGIVLAARHNERELRADPTAHAEMLALRDAAAFLDMWRILDATMYVTLEPCPMCAGALVLARVGRLVYGTPDPKAGAAGTVMDLTGNARLNHRLEVTAGVLAGEAATLLQGFFSKKRPGRQ